MNTIPTRYLRLASVLCCVASSAAAQATRDSAGIRIVDNAKPVWAPGREWRLSEKPILDIGGGAGADYELRRIVGLTRLSDRRVAAADQSTLQLKFYDASGHHLKSVGGKGQGPGEFRDFSTITRLPGDSIAVEMARMTTIVAPSGAFVRNVQFGPFAPGVLQIPFVVALGRFDNGTAVVMDYPQGQRRPAGAQRWVDSSSLFLVDHGGAVVRALGKVPVVVFVAGTTHPTPLDFGPGALHASSGRAIYLGFSDQYAIRVYNSDWTLERIIRRAWTPHSLTARDLDTYVDGWMQMWTKKTGAEREAERKEMREQPYPEFLPAYSAILATPAGDLWVREPDLTGAPGCWCLAGLSTVPSTWSVFDADGQWLGDIAMPPRFIPLEIGADYVLGRSRDRDDVPHAVMYRLDKPR
ncbi:MAG: hypothetical protein HY700_01100 [Gemmatimonadetes bacterium]|nr:hypothetical protein [Gemmatimonadota bacterium]